MKLNLRTRVLRRTSKATLALMLSALVFLVMFITMSIIGTIIFSLFQLGIRVGGNSPGINGPLFVLITSSCTIGTILTALLSRIPLKPIRKVVDACNKVADGDFSVRLKISGIDEYNQFAKGFNRMVEELGSVEMLRSDFVNNFSHEFKTPIVSLRGFAKILKDPDLTEEERNDYLDIIIHESDRLSQLSTNVLTLTRVENLNIIPDIKEFDLSEQVRRSILMLESKWEEKELEMMVDLEEISYTGNEDLLNQVWINLIDNGIKFSPQKNKLQINLNACSSGILFSVTNQGSGIKPESQQHIFDKFYQCDSSHATDGNGLGLSIVHKIVTLHQGTIELQNNTAIGTVFTVELPQWR